MERSEPFFDLSLIDLRNGRSERGVQEGANTDARNRNVSDDTLLPFPRSLRASANRDEHFDGSVVLTHACSVEVLLVGIRVEAGQGRASSVGRVDRCGVVEEDITAVA